MPDGSYSASDIQDYFEYVLKKHGESIGNVSVKTYVNKIKKRIRFRIKNGYSVEISTPETIKLLGSTENKINKEKNGENGPHLEMTEVVLVRCNIVNKIQESLYTFVSNKPFGSLLGISATNHTFLKTKQLNIRTGRQNKFNFKN